MEDIILYSTGCPRCKVLKSKLDSKNINYIECNDTDEMIRLDITTVPCVLTNDKLMDFKESVDWINSIE